MNNRWIQINELFNAALEYPPERRLDFLLHEHRLTLKGTPAGMWCVAFSPDGQTLVGGGADGTVFIWRAATLDEYHVTKPIFQARYLNVKVHD